MIILRYRDLKKSDISKSGLGILHLNISALANNNNDLKILLNFQNTSSTSYAFLKVGYKKTFQPSVNIEFPGYTIEHTLTETKLESTFYICNQTDYKPET